MSLKKHIYCKQISQTQPQPEEFKFRLMPRVKTQLIEPTVQDQSKNIVFNHNKKGKQHIKFLSDLPNSNAVHDKETMQLKKGAKGTVKQLRHYERPHDKNNTQPINTKQIHKQDVKIFQQYIQNLKNKNGKTHHKKTITFSLLNLKSKRFRSRNGEDNEHMEKIKYVQCCNIVDIIFKKLKSLREIGYSEAKINEWVLHFCDNSKPYLKDIFMKNTNKSVYNLNENYHYQRNQKTVEQKLRYKIEKKKDRYCFIEQQQLKQFAKHIQQILILKNNIKIQQIESSIVQMMSGNLIQRMKNHQFVFNRQSQLEISNFTNELNLYEKKYGEFQQFSKINKQRFDKLNDAQSNIISRYHDLLDFNSRRISHEKYNADSGSQQMSRKMDYSRAMKSTI